ncbi:MAG TPA: dihydrodipicolinate synthase family protein [Gemmatimonadetes bacterium]|nr:dihydrodipicolinate synthase family protein [Gemmatimonadota bacterium]
MTIDLSGVFVPCATPFDPVTGDLDLVGFRANVRSFLSHPLRGIVVGGTTGEAVLLDEDERMVLLEGARDLVSDDRLLVAGTGAESTRATIRLCQAAAGIGADAVLVQPPAFFRGAMTDAALLEHYRAVAAASPIPVIIYQVPLRMSTLEFANSLVAQLAKIGNVVGIKDTRGSLELVGDLVDHTPETFQVLVGNGAALYGSLELGAVGGILGVANLAPGPAAAIHAAHAAGDSAEAGRIQEVVAPVHNEVVAALGVPGVKMALDLLGLRGGDPRSPLQPLPDEKRESVASVLDRAGLEATRVGRGVSVG